MTFETLQYVDAMGATQEIALSIANIAITPAVTLKYTPASHQPGTFEITWAQPPEIGLPVPFRSRCVVYANRASAAGANNSFSGGSVLFVGRCTTNDAGRASASGISTSLTLSDILWDLSKITYQQASNEITGGTLLAPTYTPYYWPDIVLFQSLGFEVYSPAPVEGTITTWQQIEDILNYALTYAAGTSAAQFQFGTMPEFSPVYRNWYPMHSAKCLEAIQKCLATHPGVFTEVDYTTTDAHGNPLPTIHFRNRGSMTALTLPYAATDANGIFHISSEPESLPELIPDNVRLYYKINGTFNGQPIVSPGTDFYPAGNNSLLNQDFSIDVTGNSTTQTVKDFTSAAVSLTTPFGDGVLTPLNIWQQKIAALHPMGVHGQIPNPGTSAGSLAFVDTAPRDGGAHPQGIQVLGDDGVDYSASYGALIPYITDDEIFAWFQKASGPIAVVKCVVKAFFSYWKQSPNALITNADKITEHEHTFRCVLCSIPSGQYAMKQLVNAGEAIPIGLAQGLWTEQQPLQYKFGHDMLQVAASQNALPTIVKPGKHMINLAGGSPAWTAMNAVPQRVTIEFMRVKVMTGNAGGVPTYEWRLAARTQIQCGPVDHLNPEELLQLANVFWNRDRAHIDMTARLTGAASSSQSDLSLTAAAKENSMPSPSIPAEDNNVYITGGAVAGATVQSGILVSNIVAGKAPISGGTPQGMMTMQPREMAVCDNAGNVFYSAVQATQGHTTA